MIKNSEGVGSFQFTGKVVIMTNKNLTTLYHGATGNDVKAVTSRGRVSDIHATVAEQVKHMKKILPHMKLKDTEDMKPEEVKELKQFLIERIEANKDKVDPDSFSTRSLDKASTALSTYLHIASKARKNPALKEKFESFLKKTPEAIVDQELLKSRDIVAIEQLFSSEIM
jgi:hypothetical protein